MPAYLGAKAYILSDLSEARRRKSLETLGPLESSRTSTLDDEFIV